ncbi:MAG: 50S ribosomal protein L11 methyltransferase [Pseudomonadota bacterium]
MPTYTALTTLAGQPSAEKLGEALERLEPAPTGVGVFEVEDASGLWEVGGYFTDVPDAASLDLLAAAFGARPFAVSEVPEVDWVAHVRRELAPVTAGRFFVHGAHDADKVPEDAEPLLIEAAMAFGTGHHGTTKGCLEAFDALLEAGKTFTRVADIGCGTAVLAMAAARVLPDAVILAADIDAVAVEVAEANVIANGLAGRVSCLEAAGFAHDTLRAAAPFDLVFANILKSPLIDLAPAMAEATLKGGHVILSGILAEQADEVLGVYERHGFNQVRRAGIVEWCTLTLRK